MGGSSAHAEIDPGCSQFQSHLPRLLRPRGDRPYPGCPKIGEAKAPPPTRRSTSTQDLTALLRGSSAHAEIDPLFKRRRTRFCWLLRPRGDRPPLLSATAYASAAPPPTRRSTCVQARCGPHSRGSSAHAEIDLLLSDLQANIFGLLRPRGDRPPVVERSGQAVWAPPPTRRSTLSRLENPQGSTGSSAHAEIDPGGRYCRPPWSGLLRPRGDRPPPY